MQKRWFQLSSAWKSLEILSIALFPYRNNFYTEVVSSLLLYMDTNYDSTREYHCLICSRYLIICNVELPFEFSVHSEPLHHLGLKPLQALSPSIFTSTNSVVELNWEHNLFLITTSCVLFWSQDHLMIILTILSPLTHLLAIKEKISRALLLTWTIGTIKSFPHLTL